jgi:hypothetical protein
MGNSRVTKPGRTIYGGANAGRHGSAMSGPRNLNIRSTVKTHSEAMKAKTTKAACAVYPHPASNVATAGRPL